MVINPTEFAQFTQDQVINKCFNLTGKASLITLFISFVILLNFWGFLLVKDSKAKFLKISLLTLVSTGIIFCILYFMPISFTHLINSIGESFKWKEKQD